MRAHLDHLVVGEHTAPAFDGVHVDPLVLPVRPSHDLEVLHPHPGVQQARAVLRHHVGVRFDQAAHDDLTLPEGGFDHDVVLSPVEGSTVNITPERTEGTISCTTTAMAGSAVSSLSPR